MSWPFRTFILSKLLCKKWEKGCDLYRKFIWWGSSIVATRFNSIYSGNTFESRGSQSTIYKDTHLKGERKNAARVILLDFLSRKKIASVQCSRGWRKSSKSVIIGVLKYYTDQVNQVDKFYRCYFSFSESTASKSSFSSVAQEARGCCHLK